MDESEGSCLTVLARYLNARPSRQSLAEDDQLTLYSDRHRNGVPSLTRSESCEGGISVVPEHRRLRNNSRLRVRP